MITLANGTKIDEIAYGTYRVSKEDTAGKTVQTILDAIDVGYRYLDTASFYFNEEEVGEAVRQCGLKREELFVASKVWKSELGYEKTKKSIEQSLEKLNIGYIDMFLVHWPKEFEGDPDWKEKVQGSYRCMEEFYEAGLIKNLGLSNFLPHHIMAIMETAKIKPVINQFELHIGYTQPVAVEYSRSQGIYPQAWSPLGRNRISSHPSIAEMAEKYGVSKSDIMLRFLLQQDIAIVPKATSRAHMEANLHPAEFTISEEDMYFLKCMPQIGWSGEHGDFETIPMDERFA